MRAALMFPPRPAIGMRAGLRLASWCLTRRRDRGSRTSNRTGGGNDEHGKVAVLVLAVALASGRHRSRAGGLRGPVQGPPIELADDVRKNELDDEVLAQETTTVTATTPTATTARTAATTPEPTGTTRTGTTTPAVATTRAPTATTPAATTDRRRERHRADGDNTAGNDGTGGGNNTGRRRQHRRERRHRRREQHRRRRRDGR